MGALLMRMMWAGQQDEIVAVLSQLTTVRVMPVETSVAALLCRVGRIEEAKAYLDGKTIDLSPHWWFSTMVSAMAAEAALYTGRTELAASAYDSLSQFRGQLAAAGSGTALGPVDAFLAMAAATTGERERATRHAEDAARLCEQWRIPLAAEWFAGIRKSFGF
jgi:hypothetical protein